MAGPTRDFWQQNFDNGTIPWDRGGPSPQLMSWLDAVRPGTGGSCPAAETAGKSSNSRRREPRSPASTTRRPVAKASALIARRSVVAAIVEADVLQWTPPAPVDAIYEQTCLCALHPDHWQRYAVQLQAWLEPGGRLFAMFMQKPRPGAAEGLIEGPPYHCDIHAMRALLPADRWDWPKPPYAPTPHSIGAVELGVVLTRR